MINFGQLFFVLITSCKIRLYTSHLFSSQSVLILRIPPSKKITSLKHGWKIS